MPIEVPALRLGTAGFTEVQHKLVAAAAEAAAGPAGCWEPASFADADAWWLEGRRTMLLPNQHLRVPPAIPSARSVQLALADVDRPLAFTLPVAAPDLEPALTFALEDRAAAVRMLHRFGGGMQAAIAQFALAASLSEHQPTLGAGSWEVLRGGDLLAVVDLRLGAGVDPGATPADFDRASWCIRDLGAVIIPANFSRLTVSQLMWNYAQRTRRDLLPPHYRTRPLFFRRPPRVPQRQMKDAHLLLMRELVAQPGLRFEDLQAATGLGEVALARCLSALYVVGAITSNPRRANAATPLAARDSVPPVASLFESVSAPDSRLPQPPARPQLDFTAPAPLRRE
jgi:hypothetical protein